VSLGAEGSRAPSEPSESSSTEAERILYFTLMSATIEQNTLAGTAHGRTQSNRR